MIMLFCLIHLFFKNNFQNISLCILHKTFIRVDKVNMLILSLNNLRVLKIIIRTFVMIFINVNIQEYEKCNK